MNKHRNEKRLVWTTAVAGFFVFVVFFAVGQMAQGQEPDPGNADQSIADLNQQITQKRQEIEELKKQSEQFQQQVDQASAHVRDLESQLHTIENQIALTGVEIKSKQAEIEALNLEMASVQMIIDEKNELLNVQKIQLATALKELEQSSRLPLLDILLSSDTFSDFYDQAQAYAQISETLGQTVAQVRQLMDDLEAKQHQLSAARQDSEDAKIQLEVKRAAAADQGELQASLVSDAKQTESQYDEMLQQSVREEQQANGTIGALERQLQQSLNGPGETPDFNSTGFIWPLRGTITAYFHDPSYPFRCGVWRSSYCLEHSGIDIASPQGTPVRSTADGIVSVINDQGFYYDSNGKKIRSALNFVGLVHADGISSRYLHLSSIFVKPDQFIKQGDVIGLSGGLPGTGGAGGITTGAHLHLEIRVNGIPDDPLRYLE